MRAHLDIRQEAYRLDRWSRGINPQPENKMWTVCMIPADVKMRARQKSHLDVRQEAYHLDIRQEACVPKRYHEWIIFNG